MLAEALAVTRRPAGRLNDDKHALCRGVFWAAHGSLVTGRMILPQKLHGSGKQRAELATTSRQSSFHKPTLGTTWLLGQGTKLPAQGMLHMRDSCR